MISMGNLNRKRDLRYLQAQQVCICRY